MKRANLWSVFLIHNGLNNTLKAHSVFAQYITFERDPCGVRGE
jgi:hypothetical protein